MRGWRLAGVMATMMLFGFRAYAQEDINSGNFYLHACQAFIRGEASYQAGKCEGALHATLFPLTAMEMVCIPSGVTVGQVARVFVKYVENNPERLNLDIAVILGYIMGATWPCPVRK